MISPPRRQFGREPRGEQRSHGGNKEQHSREGNNSAVWGTPKRCGGHNCNSLNQGGDTLMEHYGGSGGSRGGPESHTAVTDLYCLSYIA